MIYNVLSLFDGCSCAREYLRQLGITDVRYFASEIDPYAIKVSERNFPDIVHIGDVRGVVGEDGYIFHHQNSENIMRDGGSYPIEPLDLLVGGSPCQDLSVAKQGRK